MPRPSGEEVIELLKGLISARTENPPGNETEAACIVRKFLNDFGLEAEIIEAEDGRGNLYASAGSGRTLLLTGHLDVVPPGVGWRTDPFSPTTEGGRIFGRGAADMKGGVAALTAAFVELANMRLGRVKLLLTADEERGGRMGMGWLVQNMPEVPAADFAIVGEPMGSFRGRKLLGIAEKGVVIAHVHVYGRRAHSSIPGLGDNAILKALRLSKELLKSEPKGGWRPRAVDALRYILEAGEVKRLGLRGSLAMYRALRHVVINLARIEGGDRTNVVPDHCELVLSYRIFPGQSPQDVEAVIRKTMKRLGIRGSPIITTYIEGSVLRGSAEELRILEASAERNYGHRPVRALSIAASDARFLRNRLGVPAVLFGPGESHLAHSPNEFVFLEDVLKAWRTYVDFGRVFFRS